MSLKQKVTIRDVASAASVSIATISRVLNKSPIPTKETRERVQNFIQKLNYVPQKPGRKRKEASHPAKRKTRATRTIGLVLLPRIFVEYSEGDLYYERLLKAIYQWIGHFNYHLLVCTYDGSNSLASLVTKNRLDGLIIDDRIPESIQATLMKRVPVIFIDNSPRTVASSSVRPNYETATADILSYLWGLGHRDVAFFLAAVDSLSNPPMLLTYERFYADKGYQPRVASLNVPRAIDPENHIQTLTRYAREIVASSPRPTAIVSGDTYASRISIELAKQGIKIPEEISIVGIDDSPAALHSEPLLTSYRFPMDEIGRASVEELLQKIANPSRPSRQILLDGQLVLRDSVAARAGTVPSV